MCFLVNFAQDNLQHEVNFFLPATDCGKQHHSDLLLYFPHQLIRLLYHDVNVETLLAEDENIAREVGSSGEGSEVVGLSHPQTPSIFFLPLATTGP